MTDLDISPRRGLSGSMGSKDGDIGDIFEPKPYDPQTATDDIDFAIIPSEFMNAPKAPLLVYQDRGDMNGAVTTYGYPANGNIGRTQLDGDTPVQSDGKLESGSYRKGDNSEFVRTESDTTLGADKGQGATGGMSGGGVWIDPNIPSEYDPNTSIQMDKQLAGNMTYASLDTNPNYKANSTTCGETSRSTASLDANVAGASFTPTPAQHYTAATEFMTGYLGTKGRQDFIDQKFKAEREAYQDAAEARANAPITEAKAEKTAADTAKSEARNELRSTKKNSTDEEIAAADKAYKDADTEAKAAKENLSNVKDTTPKYDKAAQDATDAQLQADIADRLSTPDKIAAEFAETTLVADIRNPATTNSPTTRQYEGVADGGSATLDGGAFRETLIANSHVNTTSDLGAGRDTVDFERLKNGVNIKIGANKDGDSILNVTKIYDKADGTQGVARDTYTDAEVIKGTYVSDSFVLNDFRDFEAIDGRDSSKGNDVDTLTIGLNVGPVTWEFSRNDDGTRSESGAITYGGRTVPFENIETVQTRPGDTVNIDGVQVSGPGMTPAAVPVPSSIPAPSEHGILSRPDHAWVNPGHLSDLPNADGSVPGVNWPSAGQASSTTPLGKMTGAMRGLFTPEPEGMSVEALSRELAETGREVKALDIEQHDAAYTSPEGWRQAHPETHARWDELASGSRNGSLSDMRVEVNLTDAHGSLLPPHDRMEALLDGVDRAASAQAGATGHTPRALSGPLSDFARDHPVPGSEAALVARRDEGAMAREAEQAAEQSAQQAAYQESSLDRMMSQTTQDLDRAAEMSGADDAYGYD